MMYVIPLTGVSNHWEQHNHRMNWSAVIFPPHWCKGRERGDGEGNAQGGLFFQISQPQHNPMLLIAQDCKFKFPRPSNCLSSASLFNKPWMLLRKASHRPRRYHITWVTRAQGLGLCLPALSSPTCSGALPVVREKFWIGTGKWHLILEMGFLGGSGHYLLLSFSCWDAVYQGCCNWKICH